MWSNSYARPYGNKKLYTGINGENMINNNHEFINNIIYLLLKYIYNAQDLNKKSIDHSSESL